MWEEVKHTDVGHTLALPGHHPTPGASLYQHSLRARPLRTEPRIFQQSFFFCPDPAFTTGECVLLKIKVARASHHSNHCRHCPLSPNVLPFPLADSLSTPICILKGVQLHGILRVTSRTMTTMTQRLPFCLLQSSERPPHLQE